MTSLRWIHFAGLKAVGESVAKPLWYYQNNVAGTLNPLDAMTNALSKNSDFLVISNRVWRPRSLADCRIPHRVLRPICMGKAS